MSDSRQRLSPGRLVLPAAGVVLLLLALAPVGELIGGNPGRWFPTAREWGTSIVAIGAIAVLLSDYFGEVIDDGIARVMALIGRPSPTAFAAALAAIVVVVCAVLSWYCFGNQASTGDEMSVRFQARLIASGHLTAVPELHREFFNTPETLDTGTRWFSQFPIGWPMLLAPAMAIGLEWLVSPLLTGVAVVCFYLFVARTTTEAAARPAAILFALSPWVLFMGASQENHMAVLALALIALAWLPSWESSTSSAAVHRSAALIGFGVAAMATIRPYDAALLAVVIGVYQLTTAGGSRVRWLSFATQLLAGAIPVAIVLYGNAVTTGQPLLFAYDALNGIAHRPGFHMSPRGFPHTPLIGLVQTSGFVLRLDSALFEWPIPAVAIVALGMMVIRQPNRWDYLLLGLMTAFIAGYLAYWSESYFARGPRFYMVAAPAFVWFVARMPGEVRARFASAKVGRWATLIIPLCTIAAWRPTDALWHQAGVVLRASELHTDGPVLKLDVEQLVKPIASTPAVVFVNESWRARLLTELRVLGVPPSDAAGVVGGWDACALQQALNDELDHPQPGDPIERVKAKVVPAGPASPIVGYDPGSPVSFSRTAPHSPDCLRELQRDSLGVVPFAMFLSHDRFDASGHLSGPVVYAMDLGDRNEQLRSRFGDRKWFRLSMQQVDGKSVFSLVPYGDSAKPATSGP